MFTNKILIQISGLSPRTFYRKLSACAIKKKESGYMDEKIALQIAKKMGFEISLTKYIELKNESVLKLIQKK